MGYLGCAIQVVGRDRRDETVRWISLVTSTAMMWCNNLVTIPSSHRCRVPLSMPRTNTTFARPMRFLTCLALALLLGANYLRYPPTDNNFRPSGRVIETAQLIREVRAQYHRLAEAYEATPASRKVLLGLISNPYVDAEVLLRAERVLSVSRQPLLGFDAVQISSQRGGRDLFSASVRVNPENAPDAASRDR